MSVEGYRQACIDDCYTYRVVTNWSKKPRTRHFRKKRELGTKGSGAAREYDHQTEGRSDREA